VLFSVNDRWSAIPFSKHNS